MELDIKGKCIIIYDNVSEGPAMALFNIASGKGVQVVTWTEKNFEANRSLLTNANKLVVFSEKVAEQYLSHPSIPEKLCDGGAKYKVQGNVIGFYVDDETIEKYIKAMSWKELLAALKKYYLLIPHPITSAAMLVHSWLAKKREIKKLCFFKAVDEFGRSKLMDFINE